MQKRKIVKVTYKNGKVDYKVKKENFSVYLDNGFL